MRVYAALAAVFLMAADSWALVVTVSCSEGFAPPADPVIPLNSLKTVVNPVLPNGVLRADLAYYIQSQTAAIQLGKALYWDMQAGSDGRVSCATCHSQAGADPRVRGQIHPGPNSAFEVGGPNSTFQAADFPFTDLQASRNRDDAAGSQGVRKSKFLGISESGDELTSSVTDAVFSNSRQATGKNAGPTVNSVFNHRNFWNGRAHADFNGINPFGASDASARVWMQNGGDPFLIDIHVRDASLASQAMGPALSTDEMSAEGRTFADLGKKMLKAKPLALQEVSPDDSVLGSLADMAAGKGLSVSYSALIQEAFQQRWWSTQQVQQGGGAVTP